MFAFLSFGNQEDLDFVSKDTIRYYFVCLKILQDTILYIYGTIILMHFAHSLFFYDIVLLSPGLYLSCSIVLLFISHCRNILSDLFIMIYFSYCFPP